MASLLLPPPSSLRFPPSSSSSSSSSSSFSSSFSSSVLSPLPRLGHCRKKLLARTVAKVVEPAIDYGGVIPPLEEVASLKLKLLSAVSGLNRGLAASGEDLRRAESATKELETIGGAVDLTKDLDKLQGRWKLIYSSAFSSRTLGGSRPGPSTGRLLPITLGQVFQRIDILSKDFDNIADLQFDTPWPLPTLEATAILAHKFELTGTSGIKITFDKTTVKPTGGISQLPPLELPRLPDFLRSNSNTESGEFEVTYLDSDFRITRGDREELRVFVIS